VAVVWDDCYYSLIPIGFSFVYCGASYTTLSASQNAWVVLGQNFPGSVVNTYYDDLSNSQVYNLQRPILAPLWIDILTAGACVRYATTGTAPNRVFTIEWNQVGFYPTTTAHCSVELILYETTNVIDFAYNFISSGVAPLGLESIGITSGAGAYPQTGSQQYWSLNNAGALPVPSMSTESRFIPTLPASNQVYEWSSQCSGKPTAGTDSATVFKGCSSYSSIIYLSGVSTTLGITYQWQSSSDSITWANIPGATVDTYATTVTTTLYYRCIVLCSNSGLSDTSKAEGLYLYTPPGGITGTAIICAGATTTLSDATAGGKWTSGSTTIATVGSGTGVVTGVSPRVAMLR
jgi:hypothetical protein